MSKNENENCRIFTIFAIACISGYKCIILDFHQHPFFKEGKNQMNILCKSNLLYKIYTCMLFWTNLGSY